MMIHHTRIVYLGILLDKLRANERIIYFTFRVFYLKQLYESSKRAKNILDDFL